MKSVGKSQKHKKALHKRFRRYRQADVLRSVRKIYGMNPFLFYNVPCWRPRWPTSDFFLSLSHCIKYPNGMQFFDLLGWKMGTVDELLESNLHRSIDGSLEDAYERTEEIY